MAQKIGKLRSRFRDSTQMIHECLSVCLRSFQAPSPALRDSPPLRTAVGLQFYKLGIQQKCLFLQSFRKVPGSSLTGPVTSSKVTWLRSGLHQTQDKTRLTARRRELFSQENTKLDSQRRMGRKRAMPGEWNKEMNLRLYTASKKPLDALSKVKNQCKTKTNTFLNLAGHLLSPGTGSLTCAALVLLHKGALHSLRRLPTTFSGSLSVSGLLSFQEPLQFPRAVTLRLSSPRAFYFILPLAYPFCCFHSRCSNIHPQNPPKGKAL